MDQGKSENMREMSKALKQAKGLVKTLFETIF